MSAEGKGGTPNANRNAETQSDNFSVFVSNNNIYGNVLTRKAVRLTYQNPLDNPKIAGEILADPKAIYGYSPIPGSSLSKFGIDWTNPKEVEYARSKRLEYHKKMEANRIALINEVESLQEKGLSIEEVARFIVNQRNQERMQTYVDSNDYIGLDAMKKRNLVEYGRTEGPTPEQLLSKYGSWVEVIYASVRTNLAMDVLTGLYDREE